MIFAFLFCSWNDSNSKRQFVNSMNTFPKLKRVRAARIGKFKLLNATHSTLQPTRAGTQLTIPMQTNKCILLCKYKHHSRTIVGETNMQITISTCLLMCFSNIFSEGCLACITAYLVYICAETHYEKVNSSDMAVNIKKE